MKINIQSQQEELKIEIQKLLEQKVINVSNEHLKRIAADGVWIQSKIVQKNER